MILNDGRLGKLILLTFGLAVTMMLVTSFFSFLVAKQGTTELITRIHERYYAYTNILCVIFSLTILRYHKYNKYIDKLIYFSNLLLFIIFFIILKNFYLIEYIDNPDIKIIFGANVFILLVYFTILTIYFYRTRSLRNVFRLLIVFYIINSAFIGYSNYNFRRADTPYDSAGKYFCEKFKSYELVNFYIDDLVSFGFFYYNCPGNYSIKYFNDFDGVFVNNSIYMGDYVNKNNSIFQGLEKINEYVYFKK